MKFLQINASYGTKIFLNVKDIKKLICQKDNYFIELFSGEIFHLETCMPEEYQDPDRFQNFLENNDIIFDEYLQMQCNEIEKCCLLRGFHKFKVENENES